MKSKHVGEFNHDPWAEEYDEDVKNESDPIRAGYDAVLAWVVEKAAVRPKSRVLELGSGTGNLTVRLPECRELVCVDISEKMETIGAAKLNLSGPRHFVKSDILEVFNLNVSSFDAIVSTYTIHHLTEAEKTQLFKKVWNCLNPGGNFVVGDLMLERQSSLEAKVQEYHKLGFEDVVESLREEFFWHLEERIKDLTDIGFETEFERLSDLSFVITAKKPPLQAK